MYMEEPKVEFVTIAMPITTVTSDCKKDGSSNQGGWSCIGVEDIARICGESAKTTYEP